MVFTALFVVTDQLFGVFLSAQDVVFHEVDKSEGVGAVLELEVQTITSFFALDFQALFLGIVLQDHLLQEQECSLVVNLLSNLHLCRPQMRSIRLLAVVTLKILNDELDDQRLLEESPACDFFLDGELDLQPP